MERLPILQSILDIYKTKLNSARPEISLVPFAACSVFDRDCEYSKKLEGQSKPLSSSISVVIVIHLRKALMHGGSSPRNTK